MFLFPHYKGNVSTKLLLVLIYLLKRLQIIFFFLNGGAELLQGVW